MIDTETLKALPEEPTEAQYQRHKVHVMSLYAPRIYRCSKCGWAVADGYCCTTCGDSNPKKE